MLLKPEDLPAVWNSGAAFARKVDPTERPGVIRALNTEVDRSRAGGGLPHRQGRRGTEAAASKPADPGTGPAAPACVVVVGMHRSGTSATAGLLIGLGLDGPRAVDLVPAAESNERGHWESETVHMCNVRVLAARGSDTYAPPPPASGWDNDSRFDPLRAEAAHWFSTTYDGRPLVLKDPRLCITLPIWRSALSAPLASILVLRDPLEVARSLQARDGLPIVLGLALWDRYMRSAALSLEGLPTLVVDYAAMVADPVKWSDVVCGYLEDLGIVLDPGARGGASKFLDASLRHQESERADYEPLVGSHREVLAVLSERTGTHTNWTPPELPPAPPWADYVLQLRSEVVTARHELYWTKSSRVFRLARSFWRLTGSGPEQRSEVAASPTAEADR